MLTNCACSVHEFENLTGENYNSDSNITKPAWNIKVKGYEKIMYFQKAP